MTHEPLKPCPACGGEARRRVTWIQCPNETCLVSGPTDDTTGSKWNALPRRLDAPEAPKRDPRREEFAKVAMHGQLCFGQASISTRQNIAEESVLFSDALIAELDKGKREWV